MRLGRGMALALVMLAGPAVAADLSETYGDPGPGSAPRYFPRGDGTDGSTVAVVKRRVKVVCTPRRVPTPTNAPDDPSYVGSPYGLGKPSYYGFTPPLGVDDPYGRSLLPYCP